MEMILQIFGAFMAVACFSGLFELPKKFRVNAGVVGGICWFVYLVIYLASKSKIIAALTASLVAAMCSHISAKILKAPMSVFLVPGVLPVVPGSSIYYCVYYAIHDNRSQATFYLIETIQISSAIAVAIYLLDSIIRTIRNQKKKACFPKEG